MKKPILYGTPLSHYTRKIRILLSELGIDFTFTRSANIMENNPSLYGENPLMRVPALQIDEQLLIESEHMARYLVHRFDPQDRFGVNTVDLNELNQLAVSNGIMANEVVLILAKRGGFQEVESVFYFRKLMTAIDRALVWLETQINLEDERFRFHDIALICMWQHVVYYQSATGLERFPKIAARVERFSARPSVAGTTPEVSLATS